MHSGYIYVKEISTEFPIRIRVREVFDTYDTGLFRLTTLRVIAKISVICRADNLGITVKSTIHFMNIYGNLPDIGYFL